MSNRITITLDKETYEFLESKANGNRSAYINNILKAEKQRIIAEQILRANQEEAEVSYQEELADWDITLSDGLS
ncbi:MAG: CopG family transcriptional regulator [Xenococcaceae cyanobacterium MO_167.B52]|nr:CopG family transcriptional regulator [Xenococcaceae cyanobacterium MO_167.B52]